MSIRIPNDLEIELQNKFPNTHVKAFIDHLFQGILNKTFSDGACTIKNVGKFVSFTTYSGRVGGKVVRFKFRPSQALISAIRKDEYLLQNLPIHAQVSFNESHEEKCKNKREQRDNNLQALNEATKSGTKKTMEKQVYNEVLNIINNQNFNDK